MYPTAAWPEKIRLFLFVMAPIVVTQIGMYAMKFIDTLMSGRAGAVDLAGVAVGSSLWLPVFTALNGIMLGLTPIAAQHIGASRKDDAAHDITQGLYLSVVCSTVVILLGAVFLDVVLNAMSLEPAVREVARNYLIGLSFGIYPYFASMALRSFMDAQGETRMTMTVILSALPVNAFFNYGLIFGNFGLPELGGAGAGYATAATYTVMFVLYALFASKLHRFQSYRLLRFWPRVSLHKWKELLKVGLPIGFTIFFETSIFAAVTLLMSGFQTEVLAAHQAAINFASLLYMLPLSIAMTLTIAVGYEVGAGRLRDANQYTGLGMLVAFLLGLFACFVIYVSRDTVSAWYTSDQEVAFWMQQFLIYAIFFQMSDAVASPIQGVLRGYKDVNVPFLIAFVSFWLIGLPFGISIASFTTFGPFGYWLGLIAALGVMAVLLFFRLRWMQKRTAALVSLNSPKSG
ncbi:MATE family multidrug resistance protein [Salsuginibacillus halophilus]|uniref:Probable multidrug resistance protein NorM n=1 Tax=Salsuginibacillus halophilus TaxID=517424 RepID=A0A2P8HBG9_9BACI|nr:MATE family efflux transporter [Salsuginibacillus halophilus]PSL43570.1 MATE family multidrug resistance protein [Salsuginibacillus halophilus]